jgi:hypothetical protein
VVEYKQAISCQLIADMLNSRSKDQNDSLMRKLEVYVVSRDL